MAVLVKEPDKRQGRVPAAGPLWDLAWSIAKAAVEGHLMQDEAIEHMWPEVEALPAPTKDYLVRRGVAEAVQACMQILRRRNGERPRIGKYPDGSVLAEPYETPHGIKQFGDFTLDEQEWLEGLMRARAAGNMKVANLLSTSRKMCLRRKVATPAELPKVDIEELEEMRP